MRSRPSLFSTLAGALFFVTLAGACAKPAASPKAVAEEPFRLESDVTSDAGALVLASAPGAGGVIFGNGRRVILNDVDQPGSWAVTLAEAQAADGALGPFLKIKRPDIAAKLDAYDGQFWGDTSDEGNHIVVLNFLCEEGPSMAADGTMRPQDWTTTRIAVKGGGSCYFQAYFDVSHNAFFALDVNSDE